MIPLDNLSDEDEEEEEEEEEDDEEDLIVNNKPDRPEITTSYDQKHKAARRGSQILNYKKKPYGHVRHKSRKSQTFTKNGVMYRKKTTILPWVYDSEWLESA